MMVSISSENTEMKPEIDLNLLRVLCAVHATRSASKAAEELGMTQSGVSNALRRLRTSFSDPLFVRCADGMQATARALLADGPVPHPAARASEPAQGVRGAGCGAQLEAEGSNWHD